MDHYSVDKLRREVLPNNGLKIMHLNCQSLTPKIDDIINLNNNSFDIMLFTETWFKDFDNTNCFPNYHGYSIKRDSGYGGVSIYAKNNLTLELVDEFTLITENYEFISALCGNTFIACIYRCHRDYAAFLDKLEEMLVHCSRHQYQLALLGDFNINMLCDDTRRCKLQELLELYDLKNYIHSVTRPVSQTLLDLAITYDEDDSVEAGTIAFGVSDHLPIFLLLKNNPVKRETPKRVLIRQFKRESLRAYVHEIEQVNFFTECCYTNVNDNFVKLQNIVKNAYDKHFPLREIKLKTKCPRKPYISSEILAHMTLRDSLYKQYIVHRTPDKWKSFAYQRNKVNRMIKKSKQQLAKKGCGDNEPFNSKVVWKNINVFLGKQCNSRRPVLPLSDKALADSFNNYYVNEAVPKVSNQNFDPTQFVNHIDHLDFLFVPTNAEEVYECIMHLTDKSSTGLDGIQSKALKCIAHVIMYPLMFIINQAFLLGKFPDSLKIAKVIPIYKGKGNFNEFGNYRPIALLSVFSKIFERLIHKRLYNYFEDFELLNTSQFGFRKNKSTELAQASN